MGESLGHPTRLERASRSVRGERSELRLEEGYITITKESATQAQPTEVSFAIDQVRAATLRRPSHGAPGWLHVAVVDGSPAPPSELAATGDPYTLPLTSRGLADARKLARLISDHVQRRGLPSDGASPGATLSPAVVLTSDPPPPREEPASDATGARSPDPSDPPTLPDPPAPTEIAAEVEGSELPERLRQLAELHRAGALTDEEFDRAKQRLLAG